MPDPTASVTLARGASPSTRSRRTRRGTRAPGRAGRRRSSTAFVRSSKPVFAAPSQPRMIATKPPTIRTAPRASITRSASTPREPRTRATDSRSLSNRPMATKSAVASASLFLRRVLELLRCVRAIGVRFLRWDRRLQLREQRTIWSAAIISGRDEASATSSSTITSQSGTPSKSLLRATGAEPPADRHRRPARIDAEPVSLVSTGVVVPSPRSAAGGTAPTSVGGAWSMPSPAPADTTAGAIEMLIL